jgi:hypothetical protein
MRPSDWRGCVVRRVRALVLGIAVLVHRPLAAVPENGLKFAVGVMLTTSSSAIAGSCSPVRSPPFVAWLATRASVPAPATGALLFVLVAAVGGLSIGWAMRG